MSDNPFDQRRDKHAIGRSGRASEKRLGKTLGAYSTPASGAIEGFKGDLQLKDFLLEAKSTVNDSLSIKYDWLVKIAKEARATNRTPGLAISFVRPDGTPYAHGEWVAIPLAMFKEIVEDA